MRRKKKTNDEHENLERWLITYSDLITLLLAFFIMMYMFSKQDAQRYEEVVGHLKSIFTGGSPVPGSAKAAGVIPMDLPAKTVQNVNEEVQKRLTEELKSLVGNDQSGKGISVFSDERGVVIRILDRTFFDEGKAELKESARTALDKILPVITDTQSHVRIEGHTDNIPINTKEFKSNWELSVSRATEVVRYFVEKYNFPPQRISAAGYAEHRPVVPNDTTENRALNRRIEIIIARSQNLDSVTH